MNVENPFSETCSFVFLNNSPLEAGLFNEELAICHLYKSEKRKIEFLTGRRCAHLAMDMAGYASAPIMVNKDRSPAWSHNIVGSITHNNQYAAAIIANPDSEIVGLGIDIEDFDRGFDLDIISHILTEKEKRDYFLCESKFLTKEVRTIFSIKESLFKCLYPINNIFLDFLDAEIECFNEGYFRASLTKNPFSSSVQLPFKLEGVVNICSEFVFSAVKLTTSQLENRFF